MRLEDFDDIDLFLRLIATKTDEWTAAYKRLPWWRRAQIQWRWWREDLPWLGWRRSLRLLWARLS